MAESVAVATCGSVMTQPQWLIRQVDHLARAWLISHPRPAETRRVAATLWWSMSVYSIFSAPIDALVSNRPVPDPSLATIGIQLGDHGAVESVRHDVTLTDPIAVAFRNVMASLITPLATVSGASPRSLWAIASDALANRALDSAGPCAARALLASLAVDVGSDLPTPRYVDVAGRTFVRRNSCCLYYVSPLAEGKCSSCPRRAPADRAALLSALSQ